MSGIIVRTQYNLAISGAKNYDNNGRKLTIKINEYCMKLQLSDKYQNYQKKVYCTKIKHNKPPN